MTITKEFFVQNNFFTSTKIMCRKCGKHESQMESHHVWCKFMDNPHGNTFKEGQPNRYWLCLDCHKELHLEITKLFNKFLETLKFNGSTKWLWKNKVTQNMKPKLIEEVINFTINWVENKDGSSI